MLTETIHTSNPGIQATPTAEAHLAIIRSIHDKFQGYQNLIVSTTEGRIRTPEGIEK